MNNNGWIELAHDPIAAGIDPDAYILVWHAHQGVLVYLCRNCRDNPCNSYWQEVNQSAWTDSKRRLPTKADADELDCVIARNRWGDILMAGWHRFANEDSLVSWQAPPAPPDGYLELRKRMF